MAAAEPQVAKFQRILQITHFIIDSMLARVEIPTAPHCLYGSGSKAIMALIEMR